MTSCLSEGTSALSGHTVTEEPSIGDREMGRARASEAKAQQRDKRGDGKLVRG